MNFIDRLKTIGATLLLLVFGMTINIVFLFIFVLFIPIYIFNSKTLLNSVKIINTTIIGD